MKKLKSLFFASLAISSVFIYSSCSTDETIGDDIVDVVNPSFNFVSLDPSGLFSGNYPTTDFEVSADIPNIYVAVEAIAGSSDLKTLTIQLDGTSPDLTDLSIRDLITGNTIVSNNRIRWA